MSHRKRKINVQPRSASVESEQTGQTVPSLPIKARRRISRHTWQLLLLNAIAVAILVMVYELRSIFNPVLLAFVIAFIFNPVVELLEKLQMGRTFAVFVTYLLICGVIIATVLILIPLIGVQMNILYEKAFVGDATTPSYLAKVLEVAEKGVQKWNEHYPQHKLEVKFLINQLADKKGIQDVAQTLFELSITTLGTAFETLWSMFWVVSYIVLLPIYTFFLLQSMPKIWETIDHYLPRRRRDAILRTTSHVHMAISCFFRGKLIICLAKGLLTWLSLELMGIKFSLLFGVIQTIASIVPFLVLAVGLVPNIILILLEIGISWPYLIAIFFLYFTIEGIEGFVLTPWIMGKETGLHPLTVILSLLIGGRLFGLFGLIMAIPITTTLKILAQETVSPLLREVLDYQPSRSDQGGP
jgi:predicted PurR-regulated permease PerM